jgi:hypothetical protein
MYFGSSLARVGADIRPLLLPIFQKRVRAAALEYWRPITQRAHAQLAKGEWGEPLPVPSTTTNNNSAAVLTGEPGTEDGADDMQAKSPPLSLLAFPVLAELTNVMVMSMNELMQCAAPSFVATLGADLAEALQLVVDGVVAFADAPGNEQKLNDDVKAKRRFVHLVDLLRDDLLPLVQGWLFAIFRLPTQHRAMRRFCDLRPMLRQLEQVGTRFHSSEDEAPAPVLSATPAVANSFLVSTSRNGRDDEVLVPQAVEDAGGVVDVVEDGGGKDAVEGRTGVEDVTVAESPTLDIDNAPVADAIDPSSSPVDE